jgi:hypothetical protein
MSLTIKVTKVIDRPVDVVFQFMVYEHVRNHPRWDPDMQLEQASDGPIGLGTIVRRRRTHSGTPVEGKMEVVEFEHNRVFGLMIQDGPAESRSRATFEPVGDGRTMMTTVVEFPGMDESADKSVLVSRVDRSFENVKRLIESER